MKKKIAAFVLTGVTIIGLSSLQVFAMGGGMGSAMASGVMGGIQAMGGNQAGRWHGQSASRSAGNFGYMHGGQTGNHYMYDELHNEMVNQHMGDAARYMGVRPNTAQDRDSQWHMRNGGANRWHTDQMGFGNNR